MISEQTKKTLKEMDATSYGKAVREWIDDECDKINNVETCNTLEELEGRKFAKDVLKRLSALIKGGEVEINNKNQYE